MTAIGSRAVGLPLALSRASIDALADIELSRCDADELLDAWREAERLRNRLAALDQRIIAEAESRGLHTEFGARNIAALVRGVLRVEPREAGARVRAADAAVGRVALSGESCPAPFAEVGAAQAAGDISPRHAAVIVRAVDRLPESLQASHGAAVERDLVEAARTFDPYELGKLARRMTTLLDQDDNRPEWIPPPWLDPSRGPRRNPHHEPRRP